MTGIHYFPNRPEAITQVSVNDYIACDYLEKYWVGLVLEVDTTQKDAQVKLMHPSNPSKTFFFGVKRECMLGSISANLKKTSATHTVTGRSQSIIQTTSMWLSTPMLMENKNVLDFLHAIS